MSDLLLSKRITFERLNDLLNIPESLPIIVDIRNIPNRHTKTIIKSLLEGGIRCFLCSAHGVNDPYALSRVEENNLLILKEFRKMYDLRIIFEIASSVDLISGLYDFDMIAIGSYNMQNYELLRAAGRFDYPILLMRGMASTIEEWLLAAEYILVEGNYRICLCENGIRSIDPNRAFVLDLASVASIKMKYSIPVLANLSCTDGQKDVIIPMAKASLSVGADGLIMRVGPSAATVYQKDLRQSVSLQDFLDFYRRL